jgi:phage terminase small subunit
MPPATDAKPPASLKGRARKVWRELAPLLVSTGILSDADLPGFERYCRLFAAWEVAMTAVEEEPTRGNVLALTKLDDMVRRAEKVYGLNPAHRASIVAVKKPEAGKDRFFRAAS